MIAYRNSTLKDMVTQLLIRAKQHRIAENIDYETCRLFLNYAVRDVVSKTRAYKTWAYMNRINVANGSLLSQDMIKFVRVVLHDGDGDHKEARYADVKEFWTVTDTTRGNLWNIQSNMNPVFTIWGNVDLAPFTNPAPPDTRIWIYPLTYTGYMDCVMYPPEMIADTDLCLVPYDYEELVIYFAMIRLLYKLNNMTVLQAIEQTVQQEFAKITSSSAAANYTKKRELDSFVEPVSPFVPPPQEEGELRQVMK